MYILEKELRKIYPNINFRLALDPDCIPLGCPNAKGNIFMFLCMDKDITYKGLFDNIIDICYKYYDYDFGSNLCIFEPKSSSLLYEVEEEVIDIAYDIFLKPEFVTKDYLNSLTEEEFKKLLCHYDFDYTTKKALVDDLCFKILNIKDMWFVEIHDHNLNHNVFLKNEDPNPKGKPFFDSKESAEDYINRYIRKLIKSDLSNMKMFDKKDSKFLDWVVDKFY